MRNQQLPAGFMKIRLFTVDEANALIPKLRGDFKEMRILRRGLSLLDPHIQPARDKASVGGGSAYGSRFVRLVLRFSKIFREVQSMGVLVKDLEVGLFDFPYRLDDRIVVLCWKHGEERIDWYHDADTGFAGRKPLPRGPEGLIE